MGDGSVGEFEADVVRTCEWPLKSPTLFIRRLRRRILIIRGMVE